MSVHVRFFASLADRTGCRDRTVDVAPGDDVGTLWDRLVREHPDLGSLGYRPLVACDLAWAEWDRALDGIREVAFLPPVSGG